MSRDRSHPTSAGSSRTAVAWTPARMALAITGGVGDALLGRFGRLTDIASASLIIARHALRPATWRPTVADETIRQSYFTGVQAMRFVTVVAILLGLGLVTQILYWTSLTGQTEYVGVIVATLLIRIITPLLVSLIVLGRSGTATVAEVGTMRVTGTVDLIESSGIDPLLYLAVPRAVAMSISVAGLAVWMVAVSLVVGYLATTGMGMTNLTAGQFADQVFGALRFRDYIAVAMTTLLSGWVVSVICTMYGLRCAGSVVNVPQRLPRCFIECLLATFIISGIVTILI